MDKNLYIKNRDRINSGNFKTYEEMHYFSEFRQNVLLWYPFKNQSKILHIGSGIGILTEFLKTKGTVISVECDDRLKEIQKYRIPDIDIYSNLEDFFKSDLHELFDYIIIEGFLDKLDNKKILMKSLMPLLKDNGEVLILANNKLALRYFDGVIEETTNSRFGNLLHDNYLLSKREWLSFLDGLGVQYKFYYPFPNYAFANQIFTDSPSKGQINLSEIPFKGSKINIFDEIQAYNSLIKSGYFEDFANSFMIVINGCSNIKYSKISKERNEKYQIFTNIKDICGEKIVEKVSINEEGITHLIDICDYYNLALAYNNFTDVKYCNVNMIDNKLIFDYIDGVSLEFLLERELEKGNKDAIVKYLNIIDRIASIGKKCQFESSKGFNTIFGDVDIALFEESECYSFSNIDLIFENIIVNDYYNVIDYEWVFRFPIPKLYIIYRTILHSSCLSSLNKDELQEIYIRFGIDFELQKAFYSMEEAFQNYVSKSTIAKLTKDLSLPCIGIHEIESQFRIIRLIQNNSVVKYSFGNEKDFQIDGYCEQGKVTLSFDEKSIIKIDSIVVNGRNIDVLNTNAEIIVGNDYYFLDLPVIEFESKISGDLIFKGIIYYYNDDCIDNIVNLMQTIKSLNSDLANLRKHKLVRLIEKIGD